MIKYLTGDIFEDDANILVNPINCVGSMGAGLAKQFAMRFPHVTECYKDFFDFGLLTPGVVIVSRDYDDWDNRAIYSVPTKDDWRNDSTLEIVEVGLASIAVKLASAGTGKQSIGATSIALPALGCGLGKLPFNKVQPLIRKHLGKVFNRDGIEIEVRVYLPLDNR